MQNKIILAVIYVVLILLSAKAFAGCEQRPIFDHSEPQADIYDYKGHVITVLKQGDYESTYQAFMRNPQFAITQGDDYFISFDQKSAYLNLIYRTNTGKAAVVYHPDIFNELYRFNTCF